jgi:hypothetical protein
MRTSPTRVDEDVFASAQMVGAVMDRSAAQQITHWARIGREIEAGSSISHARIAEVLGQGARYDDLTSEEQAIVRAEWGERLEAQRQKLDLTLRFAREGRSYVELDEAGRVVVRRPAKQPPGRARKAANGS